MKEFADGNFEFDENGRKFLKMVENTVGNEEIAHYEQFFLFLRSVSKDMYCRHVKTRAVWVRVKRPFTKTVAFAASVDQDQAAHSDLRPKLSAMLKLYRKKYPGICYYLCLIVGQKYPLGLFNALTNYHTILHFDALQIRSCGKQQEKRRNCL